MQQQTEVATEKKPYEAPQLVELGSVDAITQAAPIGDSGGGNTPSDRNLKENFAAVDGQALLERLASIPVTSWNYKSDPKTTRHIGPMAQDFAKAFGTGDSDRVIHNADSGGVSMAAIQALYELVKEQNARIECLEAEVRELSQSAVPA